MTKYQRTYNVAGQGNVSCGCMTMVLLFNALIGMWSVNEILFWFGKNIHWFWDLLIGLITAEISVPVAVVGWILRSLGVF